jgi:hypothetical protein
LMISDVFYLVGKNSGGYKKTIGNCQYTNN